MGLGASGGMGGCVPRHMHMHVHARTRMKREDKHVRKLQMAATMEAAMFIMFNMHACVCARACACVRARACVRVRKCVGVPPSNPTPTHPPTQPHRHPPTHPPPRGVPPQISKNAIRLERIKMFRFRLKIWNLWRIPHPWVGVFFGWWVGGWVG